MRRNIMNLFVLATILSLYTSLPAASIDKKIQNIQKAYENVADIKGSFLQKSYIKDLKRTDTYKGQFFIKIPMRMKWEYTGEVAQEVFIDNDEIIIYQKKERQVYKTCQQASKQLSRLLPDASQEMKE